MGSVTTKQVSRKSETCLPRPGSAVPLAPRDVSPGDTGCRLLRRAAPVPRAVRRDEFLALPYNRHLTREDARQLCQWPSSSVLIHSLWRHDGASRMAGRMGPGVDWCQ